MDAKQFAWLYLIENGLAAREPSYYGGHSIVDKRLNKKPYTDWEKGEKACRAFYLKELKEIGVNWNKTAAPSSNSVSQFTGTFSDPDYKEFMFGELVLKNGIVQKWCREAIEVTNVFEMMAMIDQSKERAAELFGVE